MKEKFFGFFESKQGMKAGFMAFWLLAFSAGMYLLFSGLESDNINDTDWIKAAVGAFLILLTLVVGVEGAAYEERVNKEHSAAECPSPVTAYLYYGQKIRSCPHFKK